MCASESAPLMSEEFAFDQALSERRAVYSDVSRFWFATLSMDPASQNLFPSAALASD
jgi:hypothetical protein